MARRKRLSVFAGVIFMILVICFVYFWRVSLVAKQAKIELDNYEAAQVCQGSNHCRQIFQARIVDSQTIKFERALGTRYGTAGKPTVQKVVCYVRLELSNSEVHDATVLTDLDLTNYHFDVSNITLPMRHGDYDDVARTSFPKNAIVHVEIWNGKVTFIYSKYVNGTEYVNVTDYSFDETNLFQLFDLNSADSKALDPTGEYAVPTSDHPLLHYNLVGADVQGVFHFSLVLIVMFLAIQYLDRR